MSRVSKAWEALQSTLNPETVTRASRVDIVGADIDEIDPPEDIDEYAEQAKNTAIVRANMRQFTNDVWGDGYRVEGPDETVAYFMGEQEDLDASPPEDTPEGGFLSQCFVYGGEKRRDFYVGGKESTWQRWIRGTVTVEYLKEDKEDPESEITGFYHIRPETLYPQVYNNTNILIDPEDTDENGVTLTPRDEAAAYIQFDDESILGLRGLYSDQQEIPLSQNDVLKQTLEPDIGGENGVGEGVFGTSIMAAISDDVTEYNQTKRDRFEAVRRKAYGVWTAQFLSDVLDLGDRKEVIEWDDDSIGDTEKELLDMGPGDVLTADAPIELKRHDGEVPDLEPMLQQYVDDITSALPAPKYMVGHANDINRDVTKEQGQPYEDLVSEEREYQERSWSKALRVVAERKDLETEGLELKLEPEVSDNPVKSLDEETIGRMNDYMSALTEAAGPTMGPTSLVSREKLLEVLDFPVSEGGASPEDIAQELSEDADTEAAWRDVLGVEALAEFEDADVVDTPDGAGIIDDIITEGTIEGMEASSDSPVYAVVVEDEDVGVGFYRESELESGSLPSVGVESPESDLEAMLDIGAASYDEALVAGDGRFEWPESWKDSSTPARVIALKAWAGMGGTWRGCRSEMSGEIASPERFCSDFKDRLLGTEKWRGGWAD